MMIEVLRHRWTETQSETETTIDQEVDQTAEIETWIGR
jgi:hypothetical protein